MSLKLRCRLLELAFILCTIQLLSSSAHAGSTPKPLPKEDQDKVDKAIDKGVKALKRAQSKEGDWPRRFPNEFFVGQCALPAYALLESGLPPNDPVIQKAAKFLRPRARLNPFTYELSLSLLFFDRLGDPQDEKLIQSLAARLIAGQHYTGGWSYRCPVGKEDKEIALLEALKEIEKRMEGGKTLREATRGMGLPRAWGNLTVFQERVVWEEPSNLTRYSGVGRAFSEGYPPFAFTALTDNSNTQFALLALWRAQQRDIAVKRTFALLVERFQGSQSPAGSWDYGYVSRSKKPISRSMTCVGLLALAVGKGLKLTSPGVALAAQQDLAVLGGLAALYPEIGVPTGQMIRPLVRDNLYYLWSVERVGMLYDLPTIGDKDWYRWAAEMLITNQFPTGKWWADEPPSPDFTYLGGYGEVINTAFALLILKHSHPMKELTSKLPYKPDELNRSLLGFMTGKVPSMERPATTPSRNEKNKR